MKTRPVIVASVIVSLLLTVLSGCSSEKNSSESYYDDISANISGGFNKSEVSEIGSDISDNISSSDFNIPPTEPNYGTCAIKSFEKTINLEGIILGNTEQVVDLFPTAMDNNNLYFSSDSYPVTISSFNRKDFSIKEIMTYDPAVELQLGNNKKTYCGCYFTFPCYGDPDGDVYLKVLVGKDGEEAKCVLNKKIYSISVCAAELNKSEMIFLCGGENQNEYELYKYKVGNEQATLIHTEMLDAAPKCNNPLIACYDEEIYFIYRPNHSETTFNIKRLDSNGKEIANDILELPQYSDMRINEFTVAENNFILRFDPNEAEQAGYVPVMINRKSKEVVSDFGDYGLGMRFNDCIIDERYIVFFMGRTDSGPMLCVFDDKNSEFHFLKFNALNTAIIFNSVVDYNGDVVFSIQESGTRSFVLYENIISLI